MRWANEVIQQGYLSLGTKIRDPSVTTAVSTFTKARFHSTRLDADQRYSRCTSRVLVKKSEVIQTLSNKNV